MNSFGFETPSALNYGADVISRRAGKNHIDARGELQIPLSMVYRLRSPRPNCWSQTIRDSVGRSIRIVGGRKRNNRLLEERAPSPMRSWRIRYEPFSSAVLG